MKNKWFLFGLCTSIILFSLLGYFVGTNQNAVDPDTERVQIIKKQTSQLSKQRQTIEKQYKKMNELQKKLTSLENENNELKKKERNDQAKLNEKKVFLTFDDGPTKLTEQILTILEENDVKATFFTIGNQMENHPDIVKKTYTSGHMVLPHSYSHDYSMYTTFETFYKDFYKAEEVFQSILGFKPPAYFRFPGGSSNHSSFQFGGKQFMSNLTTDIKNKGYHYIDWNVISGDTTPISTNPNKMLEQIKKGAENKNLVVVLFHDIAANETTAKILPDVIDYFKKQGFTFRTFRDVTKAELNKMKEMGISNREITR